MKTIAVIGAGVTGVTTAFVLSELGYKVTVFEKQRYPSIVTSYAYGGQLSASNAEVWNHFGTILKAVTWLLKKDAPLKINFWPNWHKVSWLAEFLLQTKNYKKILYRLLRWQLSLANICRKLLMMLE